MEEPKYDADGKSLYGHDGRYTGRFGDHIQPRKGFVYPEKGDEIIALADYATAAFGGTVKAGDVGRVVGCRKPGTFDQERGYMGLIVEFERVKKPYPAGFVIFWDYASDPAAFSFRKAVTTPQAAP